jgi:TolA-binding protein
MMVKFIVFTIWIICSLTSMAIVSGCDYRSNKLLTEQSTTFEKELAYKQRTQNELEMKLRKAQEDIQKLERQLECLDGDK